MPPPENALGFASTDLLELATLGLLLLGFLIWTPAVRRRLDWFAARTKSCMALLFVLPIALRLLLLPHHPAPVPDIYDEFSHLLVADTLLHLRLANATHPLHQFFETFFVLQQPTYSSIYSLGQGAMLALGRLISGSAWTGVLLSDGLLCALCYWMLRAWVNPFWALIGGLLAVVEFGPLNLWANCYWGGALAAAAGCLVFGSLPRLLTSWRKRDAALLGLGFGVHCITRQFESTLLLLCILLFLVPLMRRREELKKAIKLAPLAVAAAVPFFILTLLQNKAVTHSWLELPEQLSQYQYGVPTSLTFQAVPVPHVPLTPQQELDYKAQTLGHGFEPDSLSRFLLRLEFRVRYYRFFFLPPLYLALLTFFKPGGADHRFLWSVSQRLRSAQIHEKGGADDREASSVVFDPAGFSRWRLVYISSALAIFALGTNLFPYLLVHYLAAVTSLFVLVAVIGLERLGTIHIRGMAVGSTAAKVILLLCAGQFLLWYGAHLFENTAAAGALEPYETWDTLPHGDPHNRMYVNRQLAAIPGKLVVFVRYSPFHVFQNEWVWNSAGINASRIVWARDLGETENTKLMAYYPDRTFYLLRPDDHPPTLERYAPQSRPASSPFEEIPQHHAAALRFAHKTTLFALYSGVAGN